MVLLEQQWSREQVEAVKARGSNLLVSAAAGAGKTSVLVQRIIDYLKDPAHPVDVDRLLVVTFTNAAAAEMRERIRRQLAEELTSNPSARHLQRQLTLLNHASIMTLHSFCLEVVRQHFYRLDLDPNFRVADEGEAGLLQLEVLEELLEARYQEEDNEDFLALVDAYGGERDDAGLMDCVLKVYRFARSNPWPQGWLTRSLAAITIGPGAVPDNCAWCRELKADLALQLEGSCSDLRQAIALCRRPGGPIVYLDNLAEDLKMLEELRAACRGTWQDMFAGFRQVSFGRLKAARNHEGMDVALHKQVKDLRDGVKERIYRLRDTYFSQSPEQQLEDLQKLAPVMSTLVQLVLDFGESFRQAKKNRGIVDFGDLEHYCLQVLLREGVEPGVLAPSPVAVEMQERFIEVLVDEYQDINAVQEAILQLVSRQDRGAPNLFMVGDVKQSIYRFRLADPGLFLEKYRRFPLEKGHGERRINLKKNFRSRPAVIEGVNFVFRQVMTPRVGEITYDEEAELVCGFDYPPPGEDTVLLSPEVEVYLVDRQQGNIGGDEEVTEEPDAPPAPNGEEENEEELLNVAEMEARLVARRIRALVDSGRCIWDKREARYRPIHYADIAVLMRTTRGVANVFVDEFRRSGIPAYAELGSGYFAAGEVETMLSLLQVIDNPQQDIPLLAVLRSPLVGLSAEELAQIRCCDRKSGFYQAVRAAASSLESEVGKKLRVFLEQLEKWRTTARRERLTTLIWEVYRDTRYYDYVGGMPGGAHRQANLRLLQTWAGKYEGTTFRGLFHFLRFIERLRERGGDMGAARTLGENEDVVRIMSIHRSKGLEFPIVFVTGLGRRFNFSDLRDTILTHRCLGVGPEFVDARLGISYPTVVKLALRQRLRRETLAEEMRLLYVAMTRAREKLFLVGTVRDLAIKAASWCRMAQASGAGRAEVGGEAGRHCDRAGRGPGAAVTPLADVVLAGAGSFLDWLGPALVRHPGGKPLQEAAGRHGAMDEGETAPAGFKVRIISAGQAGQQVVQLQPGQQELLDKVRRGLPVAAGNCYEAVSRRLAWQYPCRSAVGKAAKLAVTEIKRVFDARQDEEEPADATRVPVFTERPRFVQETRGLTAAERGIAMHLVMQHLDLKRVLKREAVVEQVARMVEKELLTPEQAEAVDVSAIVRFFAGDLGKRVLQAREVLREIPFSMALPAGRVYPDLANNSDERVMVQGVIDCLADEGDGFLLLDYKTNWLGPGRLEELARHYRWQLALYTEAVESILGRPVKQKFLYFLAEGIAQEIT